MEQMCVNDKSYGVIKLLGHGKGGYSYLVTDGTKQYVLKQIHHEPCDYYQFGNKIESEMNDYECTLLVGIPNAPSIYSLKVNPDLAHQRQDKVLECMVELEYISQDEADAIKKRSK